MRACMRACVPACVCVCVWPHNTRVVAASHGRYFKQPAAAGVTAAGDAAPVPIRQLVAFERAGVAIGTTATVNFSITAQQLAVVNADGDLQVQLTVPWPARVRACVRACVCA
jgi:hypothetical protein